MSSIEDLQNRLANFQFQGYADAITRILRAYEILESTIAKIVEKINHGESGPFYVYKRAVIFCYEREKDFETHEANRIAYPLSIELSPSQIKITNEAKGAVVCGYNEICNFADYLLPLQSWDANRNDAYTTLELNRLVQSLYRALKLENDDEAESDIRDFIFSLLYVAHFRTLLGLESDLMSLKRYDKTDNEKLKDVFDYFHSNNYPFIKDIPSDLKITKEAYKYIYAIVMFDTELIDAEYLTSLIYHMVESEEAGLYGHQTSFINVEKVLQPLFLNSMQHDADVSTNETVFNTVYEIYDTVVFDPTNGPGCFLVASYNGLLQQLRDIERKFNIRCDRTLSISHFVGLVSNHLTYELSRLALTFAHTKELKRLGLLSLNELHKVFRGLMISEGNELKDDWHNYVEPSCFLRIVGSPDFKGYNKAPAKLKEQMREVFGADNLNNADLCSAWLVKAAEFIGGSEAKAAFVLTNSVTQGSQATFIHDKIEQYGCEYIFAHRSFKWKVPGDNAGITVVIIGIASKDKDNKKIITDGVTSIKCEEIGATLLPDINIRIKKRTTPISEILPSMRKGNMPDGATPLMFTVQEKINFIREYPESKKFFKELYGGDEFVNCSPRWVLWINDKDLQEALSIPGIKERVDQVRVNRADSTSSQKTKDNPHKFRETNETSPGKVSLVIPCVTSENRDYFQMGILGSNAILTNNVSVVFDCDIWLLPLLESRMHTVWAKNACGGHEQRPRYSCRLCYNTFPVPVLSKMQFSTLRNLARTLIEVREKYCHKSLAEMYLNMPPELVRIHSLIDNTVDSFYRNQPFTSDSERLIWLKNMYNNALQDE